MDLLAARTPRMPQNLTGRSSGAEKASLSTDQSERIGNATLPAASLDGGYINHVDAYILVASYTSYVLLFAFGGERERGRS